MNSTSALQNNLSPWRILAFAAVIGLIFGVYFIRLFVLQVVEQPDWAAQAEENRTREINIPTQRGIIYDRNGVVLARNIPSYNIMITAAYLPDDVGEAQRIFRDLSELIDLPVNLNTISKENPYVPCISEHGIAQVALYGATSKPYEPVPVKCYVNEIVAKVVQEKAVDWPGIGVETTPLRDYPTGALTANIIGYLGPIGPQDQDYYVDQLNFVANRDRVGYAGVEGEFQDELGGRNGLRVVEVDAAGQILRDIVPPVFPQPGNNIRLTIDIRLQQAAEAILIDEIDSWNRIVLPDKKMTSGAVIALNPQTGEILAMVSYPTYENNRLARFIPAYYYQQLSLDKRLPLLNHAAGDELPVGSVFKLVTATGALNEAVVTPETIVKTPGKISLTEKYYINDPGREKDFVDWIYKGGQNPEGFGELNIFYCLAFSSNVCFYKLGGGYQEEIPEGLGICRLGSYARALGYGAYPGVELPDTADGLIPDPRYKRINQGQSWSTGDTYIASVGQGSIIGTPLQVLLSAATVSTGGKLWEPTIVRELLDSEGNVIQPFQPKLRWDLTQDAVIEVYDDASIRDCEPTGELKTITPWVFDVVRQGMRLAVMEGTLSSRDVVGSDEARLDTLKVAAAGKTGTAEYCDEFVFAKGLCEPGNWPTHAWTVAFAPYDSPEVAVVAFVYNGGEGASTAGPVVRRVLEAYFNLKAVDAEQAAP
jgi:penicillin-binding protein 2